MENYIINNNTVAILKKRKKTIIYDVNNIRVINKNIRKVLNDNCNIYGSSFLGRKKSSQLFLNKAYKVPIILNKNIILLQLNSIRNDECLYLVFNKVISYKYENNYLNIICTNNKIFKNKISIYSFEKMLINAIKLNNIINNQKYTNIV